MIEKGDYCVAYDLTSDYYHVSLQTNLRRFVVFNWKGVLNQYNYLPFGMSTTPWVFSKVICELAMYWRAKGINILPYFNDLLFIIIGCETCQHLARIVKE
jgi:hypothetical protein